MNVPRKAAERILTAMRRMKPIIEQQRDRDVSEADTVTLVKDVLSEVCGYDKYGELTGEYAIRGTYCDIAIQIEHKLVVLVEVKAVGIGLDDRHVKQAIDYAANQGVEWVILTNARVWRLYHVEFTKPIDKHLLCEVDITSMDFRKADDAERFYPFSREAVVKGILSDILDRQQATSRYMIAALLLANDALQETIRRELKRVADVSVDTGEIVKILREEVIKRDAIDGKAFEDAVKLVDKREKRTLRAITSKPNQTDQSSGSMEAGSAAASQVN